MHLWYVKVFWCNGYEVLERETGKKMVWYIHQLPSISNLNKGVVEVSPYKPTGIH